MYEWQKQIQIIVDEIDQSIKNYNDESLTLHALSGRLGYSEFYTTRKFKEISGMQFRDYLRHRKLAFALKEVRDSEKRLLILLLLTVFHPMKLLPEHLRQNTASLQVNTGKNRNLWFSGQK